MPKSKLERVLEHMVNDEMNLAKDLLHEHFVESAREIYADLSEEDDQVEDELELDEDWDLDEAYDDSDASGDFQNDIETIGDEVDAEEYFSEDDDEDEDAFADLEGEMDGDYDIDDDDMDMDIDGEGTGDASVEDAMVNVEDALDELRAVFADIVGDTGDEDDMDDEYDIDDEDMDDEYDIDDEDMDDEDMDDEESFKESASLKKYGNVKMAGGENGKGSAVRQNAPDLSGGHAKQVNIAGKEEKGGKVPSSKKMNVTGPQDQGGKFDKKVAAPKNASEKSKSNIGS